MGTRALEDDRWFLVDDEWASQRGLARELLATRRDDVVAGSAVEAATAFDAELVTWLGARGVDPTPDDDHDQLVVARTRVADDLCVVTPSADGWVLAAGAVCFPSLWRLREKVGRPLADVHDPVPGYGGLTGRVEAFLRRLAPGRGAWRRNWSIHATDDLFVPEDPHAAALPAPEGRILRSERQTLRRLHEVDAVVFTIRTQQTPISALATRPEVCASLAAAVRAWTPAQRAYKGHAVDDALLRWLDGVRGRTA